MHPTSGEIRACLDGEGGEERDAKIRSHVLACSRCRERVDRLEASRETVGTLLSVMDSSPDLSSAKRDVLRRSTSFRPGGRRTDGRRPGGRRLAGSGPNGRGPGGPDGVGPNGSRPDGRRLGRYPLRTAAAILLLAAGAAAAAVPGSPFRAWLENLGDLSSASSNRMSDGVSAGSPEQGVGALEGPALRVAPEGGSLRIRLIEVEEGTRIRVQLVNEAAGGVSATSVAGFRTGPGLLEATGAAGDVTVEIPRSAFEADVSANGRVLFRKSGEAMTLPGGGGDSAELLFVVP